MKARFIIGYILLAFGILGSIWSASVFIILISAPPPGEGIAGLIGLVFIGAFYFSILSLP